MGAPDRSPQRQRIAVRGIVQGVGFRPFVHRLATELSLGGWVRNDGAGVSIELQGDPARLAAFAGRLRSEAPRLARIDRVAVEAAPLQPADAGFAILSSGGGPASTAIGPDSATCEACLAELCDPRDRRYRHAFINCTDCGPRYTLTRALPYDRAMTSMAAFVQCPQCLAEYGDPAHRRFHAEPNACPACGPRLQLLDARGAPLDAGRDPIAATLARIRGGAILAIKGLGGFHLVCDARNARAIALLRERKQREEKPFAVMLAGAASVAPLAALDAAERELLQSPERPIVLLRKHAGADAALPGVAPGLAWLGLMLPYTPLQYLLFHEAAGRPEGTAWLREPQALALVMTSANPGGEPLVTGNAEALERLGHIADALLLHDREILVRCDDSVLRATPAGAQLVRRARGWTPRAVPLARAGEPVLALGGWFKNTVCVTRADEAFVSQHVGDLDNAATCAAHEAAVAHLLSILRVEPRLVAHDLHPDFHSTRFALALAAARGIPALGVQHHHAHVAAVLAEHAVEEPVLGLALDGVGLGIDGEAWGGELLRVDGARFTRLGRLRPLALPGGDRAAREPWRMGAAVLARLGRGTEIPGRFATERAAGAIAEMLARGTRTPQTSSLGRCFDAAAGLLGVRAHAAFEGQAAMLLEGLAEGHGPSSAPPGLFRIAPGNALDLDPLFARLADTPDASEGAALFHAVLVEALAEWVAGSARAEGLRTVAGAGGCFLNAILAGGLRAALARRGLRLLEAAALPPNDGGLCLGQAWIAQRQGRD